MLSDTSDCKMLYMDMLEKQLNIHLSGLQANKKTEF